MQERIKSPVVWLSVVALVGFVAKTYFNYEIPQLDTLADMVLAALIGFGVLNNPTNKIGF